jgi:hypothetical protein
MHFPPIDPPASASRFAREVSPPARTALSRWDARHGAARPGDVLTLAGGVVMRDLNQNGLVDGHDEPIAPARGALVDVRV